MSTKICLVLTEETLENNLKLVNEYAGYYDLVELRVDLLFSNETFYVRKFPSLVNVPVVLTCRRMTDGGKFKDGEGARITVLAKALAFLDNDKKKNFAYVDFESDFASSALEEAARAFDIKIIRSVHNTKAPLTNISKAINEIRRAEDEIPKLATVIPDLKDFIPLLFQSPTPKKPYILSGIGKYGYLSRIFSKRIGSEMVYTFSKKYIKKHKLQNELIDPITLNELYGFKRLGDSPKIYAVVGQDVQKSKSPIIHNDFFKRENISSCYVPISVSNFDEFFTFAKKVSVQGVSVTAPFKMDAYKVANKITEEAKTIKAINTLCYINGNWVGANTDILGFKKALLEFLENEEITDQYIAVIGAGGVAGAVCYTLFEMLKSEKTKRVCVFNRTKLKAEKLASKYNFDASPLLNTAEVIKKLKKFSTLIINCTTVGTLKLLGHDPIYFYNFTGNEKVFDLIYEPDRTKLLQRAKKSGCKICNGYRMLELQAEEQFKIFTQGD